MCGISGFVSKVKTNVKNLKAMTDIIVHRGPDDEGYAVFGDYDSLPLCFGGKDTPNAVYRSFLRSKPRNNISSISGMKAEVALGHRRLSILDLSFFGHQPMCSEDAELWITYNGEIYNYLELRHILTEKGYRFMSDTDTEVILAAYREWGTDCLDRFIGMWAFAIYDNARGEIFLARDRFGIKPLYYWFDPEKTFYFGSEIKQFTVLDGWKATVNSQRAYDYLIYSLTDHCDETMFNSVFHLPAGHYYKAKTRNIWPDENGKLDIVKWYDLTRKPSNMTFEEASEGFAEHFKNAVRIHLRSNVPVGSALSGGLDSSAIVCEINNILNSKGKNSIQKTFSSCSKLKKYDEKRWMDIVVNHTGIDAHFIYPDTENLFDLTSTILWHQDEPYQSQSAYLGYHVFKLAKEKRVKVLLNGQGADEYLGGYGQFNNAVYYNLFRNMKWNDLLEEVQYANGSSKYQVIQNIGYLLVPERVRNVAVKYYSSVSDIKKLIAVDELKAKNSHPYTNIPNDVSTVPGITKLNLFHNPLTKYLRWEDRNSMAHSIEARVPFLDHRLVEFTFNLHPEYLYTKGVTKRVMRHGLREILPYEIANRKDKKGFITPEEHWVKYASTEIFRNRIAESVSETGGIINKKAISYFDDIVGGKKPFDYTYIRLILFTEWMKIFNLDHK